MSTFYDDRESAYEFTTALSGAYGVTQRQKLLKEQQQQSKHLEEQNKLLLDKNKIEKERVAIERRALEIQEQRAEEDKQERELLAEKNEYIKLCRKQLITLEADCRKLKRQFEVYVSKGQFSDPNDSFTISFSRNLALISLSCLKIKNADIFDLLEDIRSLNQLIEELNDLSAAFMYSLGLDLEPVAEIEKCINLIYELVEKSNLLEKDIYLNLSLLDDTSKKKKAKDIQNIKNKVKNLETQYISLIEEINHANETHFLLDSEYNYVHEIVLADFTLKSKLSLPGYELKLAKQSHQDTINTVFQKMKDKILELKEWYLYDKECLTYVSDLLNVGNYFEAEKYFTSCSMLFLIKEINSSKIEDDFYRIKDILEQIQLELKFISGNEKHSKTDLGAILTDQDKIIKCLRNLNDLSSRGGELSAWSQPHIENAQIHLARLIDQQSKIESLRKKSLF